MGKNDQKLRKIPRVVNDDLTLRLWSQYVTVEEEKDITALKSLLAEIERMPVPSRVENPILLRIINDGAGFDGLNASMMTYSYLRLICRHFIKKIK